MDIGLSLAERAIRGMIELRRKFDEHAAFYSKFEEEAIRQVAEQEWLSGKLQPVLVLTQPVQMVKAVLSCQAEGNSRLESAGGGGVGRKSTNWSDQGVNMAATTGFASAVRITCCPV